MRYITALSSMALVDPSTDEPAGTIAWKDAIRALFQEPRVLQQMNVFDANDLRLKLRDAAPGDVVELRDDEWSVLAEICKQPKVFTAAFVYGGGLAFLRAFTDAPTTKPAVAT